MTKQKRRKFTPQDKVAILKEHLVDGRAVSEVCDKHQLNPNQFYQWQKQFFENGAEAFRAPKVDPQERMLRQKVADLEKKLSKKDRIIAEISEEYVDLKKALGEP